MTERELALYEIVAKSIPSRWRDCHLMTSEREYYERLTAYLEAECGDLKAERATRLEERMIKAGWVREGNGWTLTIAA